MRHCTIILYFAKLHDLRACNGVSQGMEDHQYYNHFPALVLRRGRDFQHRASVEAASTLSVMIERGRHPFWVPLPVCGYADQSGEGGYIEWLEVRLRSSILE